MAKTNNVNYYKMKREDGEEFEIKEDHVELHEKRGYELVSDEPITRDINTSSNVQSEGNDTEDKQVPDEESQEDETEEDDIDSKSVEDMSYKELQAFVSANTDNYKVIGKKTEELQEKAKEIQS